MGAGQVQDMPVLTRQPAAAQVQGRGLHGTLQGWYLQQGHAVKTLLLFTTAGDRSSGVEASAAICRCSVQHLHLSSNPAAPAAS